MKRKVTLQDLSKKLGLSTAAISKALRGHEGVSDKTRKLVIDTAKQMKYKGVAEDKISFAAQKVMVLADHRSLADPHTISSFFHIERTMKEQGLEVIFCGINISNLELSVQERIRNERPLAVLMFNRVSRQVAEQIVELSAAVILIDQEIPYFHLDTVLVNNYEGAFLAVQHLAKMGHLRIGFIGDNKLSYGFRERYHGFCDALEFWGLELNPDYIYDLPFKDGYDEIHFHILPDRLNYNRLPTAFFCANDPIAFILNNALKTRGIATPEEISIIGFDNLDACQWQYPQLTSVDYPREFIARQTLNLLLWRLDNKDAPANKIKVQPELILRNSVTPPPKKSQGRE